MSNSPQVSIRVQFERPVNLGEYTKNFVKAYTKSINKQMGANAHKFAEYFQVLHNSDEKNVPSRSLPPVFTGSSGDSINAEWEPLSDSGRGVLTVGYRPQGGREGVYIPAIEGGWKGGQGGGTRRGKTLTGGPLGTSYRKLRVSNSPSQGNSQDSEAETRLKYWAYSKLGLTSVRGKKMSRKDRARYWALKKKVLNKGEHGRNIVGEYGRDPYVLQLWESVNKKAVQEVSSKFKLTASDKRTVTGVLIRGAGL
jgi:hypothetical protein